jgi:hypothetical protein
MFCSESSAPLSASPIQALMLWMLCKQAAQVAASSSRIFLEKSSLATSADCEDVMCVHLMGV